jgi:hypothetical protein
MLEDTMARKRQVNFHLDSALMAKFKVRAIREKVPMRAIVEALVEGYVKGEFNLEDEKSCPEKGER